MIQSLPCQVYHHNMQAKQELEAAEADPVQEMETAVLPATMVEVLSLAKAD